MKRHKFYMRKKGRFNDGRIRYVLEWLEGKDVKSIAVPKPEALYKVLMDTNKKTTRLKGE